MTTFSRTMKRFFRSEDGPTTIEYAVMLALIIIVAIGAISGIGVTVSDIFVTVDNGLPVGAAS